MSDASTAAASAASERDSAVVTSAQSPEVGADNPSQDAGEAGGQLAAVIGGEAADQGGDDYAPWGEKWREDLTGGDEASLKLAARFTSPRAVWQKLLAQEQVIRRGAHKGPPTLAENATDEQRAEYRKAVGVPETPDGYDLKFAPEANAGEIENSIAKNMAAFAHERNIPAKYMKEAFEGYQQELIRTRQEEQTARQRAIARNDAEYQKEWGGDYSRNARLLADWMEVRPSLSQAVKAFAHDKGVLQELMQDILDMADPEALIGGEPGLGGKGIDDRIDELAGKYGARTAAENKEYERLIEARLKRDEGGGRRSRAA
jgi:hypothetical protein